MSERFLGRNKPSTVSGAIKAVERMKETGIMHKTPAQAKRHGIEYAKGTVAHLTLKSGASADPEARRKWVKAIKEAEKGNFEPLGIELGDDAIEIARAINNGNRELEIDNPLAMDTTARKLKKI